MAINAQELNDRLLQADASQKPAIINEQLPELFKLTTVYRRGVYAILNKRQTTTDLDKQTPSIAEYQQLKNFFETITPENLVDILYYGISGTPPAKGTRFRNRSKALLFSILEFMPQESLNEFKQKLLAIETQNADLAEFLRGQTWYNFLIVDEANWYLRVAKIDKQEQSPSILHNFRQQLTTILQYIRSNDLEQSKFQSRQLFYAIASYAKQIPDRIRDNCRHIYERVLNKISNGDLAYVFSDADKQQAIQKVGGYLFLRILTPIFADFIAATRGDKRKALLKLSIIFQAFVNGVTEGKSNISEELHPFILETQQEVFKFLFDCTRMQAESNYELPKSNQFDDGFREVKFGKSDAEEVVVEIEANDNRETFEPLEESDDEAEASGVVAGDVLENIRIDDSPAPVADQDEAIQSISTSWSWKTKLAIGAVGTTAAVTAFYFGAGPAIYAAAKGLPFGYATWIEFITNKIAYGIAAGTEGLGLAGTAIVAGKQYRQDSKRVLPELARKLANPEHGSEHDPLVVPGNQAAYGTVDQPNDGSRPVRDTAYLAPGEGRTDEDEHDELKDSRKKDGKPPFRRQRTISGAMDVPRSPKDEERKPENPMTIGSPRRLEAQDTKRVQQKALAQEFAKRRAQTRTSPVVTPAQPTEDSTAAAGTGMNLSSSYK